MPKELSTLELEAKELLTNIQTNCNDYASTKYWKALAENLQQQTEILKTQVENLKRQIR